MKSNLNQTKLSFYLNIPGGDKMTLNAINSYVNAIISSNRDSDRQNIVTYFKLMSERANEMLQQLEIASTLPVLKALDNSYLTEDEKQVVSQAVDYILKHSEDLAKGLSVMERSGLLSLEFQLPENRYRLTYMLEPVLIYASQLYSDNLGWWDAFIQRNNQPRHFIDMFENLSKSTEIKVG